MLALAAALAVAAEPAPFRPDLVITNARVWTGDPNRPTADTVVIWRDRIVAVGSRSKLPDHLLTGTRTIDAGGRRVVPGFHDSHAHFLGGGQQLARVELKDAKDEAEFGRRLREFDQKLPRDRWILGGNWDHDRTFGGQMPTAQMVDKYVQNRPVFIQRYDGHMALCNTAALKLAKVTAATTEVPGGVIYRLADGKSPSGVLKDNAMTLVDRLVPEPDDAEIAEAVRAALHLAASVGVTSVQDMEGSGTATRRKYLRVLQKLASVGEMSCRVDVRWPIAAHRELAATGLESNFGGSFVRVGGVKGFMDGSLGSSTAKMFEPFLNEKTTGVYVTEPDAMRQQIRGADAAGLSVAVHAIGDQANSVLLDLYAEVAKANGAKDRRFRVEHAQHLRPRDYPRFKAGGVVASMQPYHVADDGRWALGRIGAERCRSSYAYRGLLDAGAVLAFGSDWPVAPLDPLPAIDAAVNRRTLDGKDPNGWFPEQRITVEESLRAFTVGSAYAAHQEGERGMIGTGKLADLVVLDRDILDPKEQSRIGETKVTLTVVGGKVVFERK